MRILIALLLTLLFVGGLVLLGVGDMADCPLCTGPDNTVLALCVGVLVAFALFISLFASWISLGDLSFRKTLLRRLIYRPPRLV